MNKKISLWRGLSAVMAFLFILSIFGGQVANANAGGINNFLGLSGNKIEPTAGNAVYVSDYGDLTSENLAKLIADEMEYCIQQLEEGSVLLSNNGALPLATEERNITLFGRGSADIVYKNAAGGPSPDPSRQIDLRQAFHDAGFTTNDTLYDAYKNSSTTRVKAGDETEDIGEEKLSFYTDSLKSTYADYSDAAIVVLSRYGGESTDMSFKNVEGVPSLSLNPSEADMLQMINDSGVFNKIIVLINSIYPIELGWLDEYNVDACLWIGNPGYYGLPGVVNILTGAANPSGRLVDTYATNSLSSAAAQNFGEFRFENGDALPSHANRYVVYQEGIYVGYKYYETRYEDVILGQGNADGSAGIFASTGEKWNYSEEMCYPFGYGLSYTTFEQKLDSCDYDAASDTFTASVTVTNTGETSGKCVVELYVQTPYTNYDQEHGVEKAAIQLVGYAKTQELEPGTSEMVEISVNRYLLASYDVTAHDGRGGYILDAGNYYFAIGNDCHDALNNILAAKGATGMFDQYGNSVEGDISETSIYTLDVLDDQSYLMSPYTGNEVHNLFADADANYFYDDSPVTYLSRKDWQGTWSDGVALSSNAKLEQALVTANYQTGSSTTKLSEVPYGEDAGLTLYDMIGVDYDDPKWDTFIKQLSLADLGTITSENYGQSTIESISKPPTVTSEGPEGISRTYQYGDEGNATGYASGTVTASTWSHDMQSRFGYFYGEDALYAGVHAINGHGNNLHRIPYGGRAAEYYSEDGILAYYTSANVLNAMSKKGLMSNIKHFFLNEQEYDRQGVATFSNEQAIREIYLRAYELAVTGDGARGMMTSYNRLGATYMAANSTVQFDLLRDEWGYKGYLITDYIAEGEYAVTADMMINGTNIYGGNDRSKSIMQLISRNSDGDMLLRAQESAHRILWAYANSSMANSLSPNATYTDFVAWWQYALIGLQATFAILALGSVALYVKNAYLRRKSA